MSEDLKKLAEKLGPEFALAVLTNKERDITLEKSLYRSEPGRGAGDRDMDRERQLERERDLERGR